LAYCAKRLESLAFLRQSEAEKTVFSLFSGNNSEKPPLHRRAMRDLFAPADAVRSVAASRRRKARLYSAASIV
jgi:hypothetical protein